MGVLRGIGYFIAILILIGGVLTIPMLVGIPVVIVAIIMMYALHKGGQVTNMQKSLKEIKQINEENQRLKLDQMRKDALDKRDDHDKP